MVSTPRPPVGSASLAANLQQSVIPVDHIINSPWTLWQPVALLGPWTRPRPHGTCGGLAGPVDPGPSGPCFPRRRATPDTPGEGRSPQGAKTLRGGSKSAQASPVESLRWWLGAGDGPHGVSSRAKQRTDPVHVCPCNSRGGHVNRAMSERACRLSNFVAYVRLNVRALRMPGYAATWPNMATSTRTYPYYSMCYLFVWRLLSKPPRDGVAPALCLEHV